MALPAMVVLKAMVILKLFFSIGEGSAADEELSLDLLCSGELVHRWVGGWVGGCQAKIRISSS